VRGFTVGFTLGLAVVLWTSTYLVLAGALAATLGVLAVLKNGRIWRRCLLGLCTGALAAQMSLNQQLSRQFNAADTKTDYLLVGTVTDVPKKGSRHTSFMFRVDRFVGPKPTTRPRTIRLSWYHGAQPALRAGDQWQLVARLKPASSLGNPGGFNYTRWLFQNRIHALGYVKDSPPPKRLKTNPYQLAALRQQIAQRIQTLPAANEYAALVQGLTVGITNEVSAEQWQTLRRSGTAHLMAISGLHIGLIAGWFLLLAGGIWLLISRVSDGLIQQWCSRPIFGVALSCLGASLYAALAGFSLPTQRALIMLGVFALTSSLTRVWPPGSALLLALFLVLLIDPLAVLSVGFWLSFGTVAALFYLHNGRMHKHNKVNKAIGVHLKLSVVLLPASAWFFQQGALLAPFANAIAVPVVGIVVVPMSFLVAIFATSLPKLANVLLVVTQWALRWLLDFLDWLNSWPASNVPLFVPDSLLLLCVLVGCGVLFAPRGLGLRWLSVPLMAPIVVLNLLGKPVRGIELHVLDVGQGLAAVLFTQNHTVLFDTGKRISGDVSMMSRVVQPFLVSQGRSEVDVSIISHGDDDHAGGLHALLDYHPQTKLFSGDSAHQTAHGAQACLAGQTFTLDAVTFSFLHPGLSDAGSDNNLSCVLLIHYGKSRLLLTGDIESESEKLLIDRIGSQFPVTVMVAPHHGRYCHQKLWFLLQASEMRMAFHIPMS